MRPSDFNMSLRGSSSHIGRRRTLQRVLGFAGVALLIASCASEAPANSAQPTPAITVTAVTPSTLADPPPATAADPPPAMTAAPETADIAAPPSTIAEPPATTAPATPAAACRRLTDFDGGNFDGGNFDGAGGWVVVNDGVMGGRSNGVIESTDSAMRFTGDVVTAGGGFTSVRLLLTGDELTDSDYLALRVRSDERTYGLTLEDTAQTGGRSISHRADLIIDGPADADGWQTAAVSYAELRPSVFGQPLDAPAFNPDQAVEFGIIIADGIDGPFEVEVDWIDACISQ